MATQVILSVGLFLVSSLLALIGIIFHRVQQDIAEIRRSQKVTNRRLGTVAASGLVITMKLTHAQDFLEKNFDYLAPKSMGSAETREDWGDLFE